VLGVGAADATGGEDPHRGLKCPQLEAEDEVVTNVEAMAEGEGPPAAGKDGTTARPEEDVYRPEEIWPALFPQSDLPGDRAGGVNHPLDAIEQPEGAEARGVDDDEELQEAGPRADEGSQHRRR
jgi:hypothetical protein